MKRMVKFLIGSLFIALAFVSFSLSLSAKAPTVDVNGDPLFFDQPPIIQNGRTLVPLRGIFEQLGAIVEYDSQTKRVTAYRDTTKVVLTLGSKQASINNQNVTIDVPAMSRNGRTLVPLRFIGEALGSAVNWNGATSHVAIEDNNIVFTNPYADITEREAEIHIASEAEKEWPGDYEMQLYTIESQLESFNYLKGLLIDRKVKYDIMNDAIVDWGNDFTMVMYSYDEGMKAYYWLRDQNMTGAAKSIFEQAYMDWAPDYTMLKYQYEDEVEAYNWIQNQVLDTETKRMIMQEAKNTWGTDYSMVKYAYERQLEAYDTLENN